MFASPLSVRAARAGGKRDDFGALRTRRETEEIPIFLAVSQSRVQQEGEGRSVLGKIENLRWSLTSTHPVASTSTTTTPSVGRRDYLKHRKGTRGPQQKSSTTTITIPLLVSVLVSPAPCRNRLSLRGSYFYYCAVFITIRSVRLSSSRVFLGESLQQMLHPPIGRPFIQ